MSNFIAEAQRRGEDRGISASRDRSIGISRQGCVVSGTFDHPITCDHPITRSATESRPERARAIAGARRRIYVAVRGTFQVLVAVIREVFDESPYERYLAHTRKARSVASYRAFLQEQERRIAQKPRCC